jgi:Holliday junction resolvase
MAGNPNYRKGTRAERLVKSQLEVLGHHVVRRYASKGPYDLLALPQHGRPLTVEVKSGSARMSPKERYELHRVATRHQAVPVLAYYAEGVTTYYLLEQDPATGLVAADHAIPIETGAYREDPPWTWEDEDPDVDRQLADCEEQRLDLEERLKALEAPGA